MAPDTLAVSPSSASVHVGPHASYIQVAKPYIFEQKIQECMISAGVNEVKEDSFRLQGVSWIDSVRKALHLPVRTFNTAVVYYHKFRLAHPDSEYNFIDAAAAALFTACKVEDTLKKSKDILCAAYNLKLSPSEQLSPDDPIFESHSKAIIGLERLMLEASGFDFRNRYPQKVLIKLAKKYNVDRDIIGKTAYDISVDLYRTFTPLKQSSSTMAMACLELSARIHESNLVETFGEQGFDYKKWSTSREEVMETLLDLLDLYTHHRSFTIIGQHHNLDTFLTIRISLNQEATSHNYPRYTQWHSSSNKKRHLTNGHDDNHHHHLSPSPKHRKESHLHHHRDTNSTSPSSSQPHQSQTRSPSGSTPTSGLGPNHRARAGVGIATATERGREGTVRFMLDAGRARTERGTVDEFFRLEEEEYVVEVEVFDDDGDDERR